MDDEEIDNLKGKLRELKIEHMDLDYAIQQLGQSVSVDEIRLRRLKKRKLLLKDMIHRIESRLIPDLDA